MDEIPYIHITVQITFIKQFKTTHWLQTVFYTTKNCILMQFFVQGIDTIAGVSFAKIVAQVRRRYQDSEELVLVVELGQE